MSARADTRPPGSRRRLLAGALLLGAIMLVALFPLKLALNWAGLERAGLTAEQAHGTIWSGRLDRAFAGPLPLGALDTALKPLPLLAGRSELAFTRPAGDGPPLSGRLIAGIGGRGARNVTGAVPAAHAFAPLPVRSLRFDDVSVLFDGQGRCQAASGVVGVDIAVHLAGLTLAHGLSGQARCSGGKLVLPLASQSGLERLVLSIAGDGQYQATLSVAAGGDPLLSAGLLALGFSPVSGGYQRRFDGRL